MTTRLYLAHVAFTAYISRRFLFVSLGVFARNEVNEIRFREVDCGQHSQSTEGADADVQQLEDERRAPQKKNLQQMRALRANTRRQPIHRTVDPAITKLIFPFQTSIASTQNPIE